MQVPQTAQNKILDIWGPENFAPAALSSTGCVLGLRAGLTTLSYFGAPKARSITEISVDRVKNFVEARRGFRETWLSSFAVAIWNISEIFYYTMIGVVASVAFRNNAFINLAQRAVVQFVANTYCAALGFVGQFSPLLGVKMYLAFLKGIHYMDPNAFGTCVSAITKDAATIPAGVAKVFAKSEVEELARQACVKGGEALNALYAQFIRLTTA